MQIIKEESLFLLECIEHYWDDYNRHHEDNQNNKRISDKVEIKLKELCKTQ